MSWKAPEKSPAREALQKVFARTNPNGTARYSREQVLVVTSWLLRTIDKEHPGVQVSGDESLLAELLTRANVKPEAAPEEAARALGAFAAKHAPSKELIDEVFAAIRKK